VSETDGKQAVAWTVCMAVDETHAAELELSWQTLVRLKPDIRQAPLHVYCDSQRPVGWWQERLAFLVHPQCQLFSWAAPMDWPQRERMLSAFVFGPPQTVETPWFLKLDTDAVATRPGPLVNPAWLENDPVFVSAPWGYSIPSNVHQVLDDWCDRIPELAEFPRLDLSFQPEARTVRAKRIISWYYLGRTDWHRWLATLCQDRLPVPSHDTLCWHVAKRTGAVYRREKLSAWGWNHVRPGNLRNVVSEVLQCR
jgi:hypothetical protein